MNDLEPYHILKIARFIQGDRYAAIILAATMKRPLSAQQIGNRFNIPSMQCCRTIRKLRKKGLIEVVKIAVSKESLDKPIFLYKARLDRRFIRFENGKLKVKFPVSSHLSNGKKIDSKVLFESHSI